MNPNQQNNPGQSIGQMPQPGIGPQPQNTNVPPPKAHGASKLPWIIVGLLVVLLIGALVFGFWAYGERSDYKNNSDAKAAEAVRVALDEQKEQLSKEFAEEEKSPYLVYQGPETYGSIRFEYPKTWSSYTEESTGNDLLTVHMHPRNIDDVDDKDNKQAFVLEVRKRNYESEADEFENAIEKGEATSQAYRPELIQDVLGLRVAGQMDRNLNGTRVYLPVRDRTLVLTTEDNSFVGDFDRILSTLKFTP